MHLSLLHGCICGIYIVLGHTYLCGTPKKRRITFLSPSSSPSLFLPPSGGLSLPLFHLGYHRSNFRLAAVYNAQVIYFSNRPLSSIVAVDVVVVGAGIPVSPARWMDVYRARLDRFPSPQSPPDQSVSPSVLRQSLPLNPFHPQFYMQRYHIYISALVDRYNHKIKAYIWYTAARINLKLHKQLISWMTRHY